MKPFPLIRKFAVLSFVLGSGKKFHTDDGIRRDPVLLEKAADAIPNTAFASQEVANPCRGINKNEPVTHPSANSKKTENSSHTLLPCLQEADGASRRK